VHGYLNEIAKADPAPTCHVTRAYAALRQISGRAYSVYRVSRGVRIATTRRRSERKHVADPIRYERRGATLRFR